jgi:hypothetical protein
MNFTRIQPFGPDAYTWWFSGIYKIVSYRKGEYLAFYIREGDQNWGWHVSEPPDTGKHGQCCSTLKAAKGACAEHAKKHKPSNKTVRRAAEIKESVSVQ